MDVQLITPGAVDSLTDEDYVTIYHEIVDPGGNKAKKMNLRPFRSLIIEAYMKRGRSQDEAEKEAMSIAYWSKVDSGDQRTFSRRAKNNLRVLVGQSELPPPAVEVLADVPATAAVYGIGNGAPQKVILVRSDEALHLYVNSEVIAETLLESVTKNDHGGNPARASRASVGQRKGGNRRLYVRMPPAQLEEVTEAQKRLNVSWAAVMLAGVKALLAEQNEALTGEAL